MINSFIFYVHVDAGSDDCFSVEVINHGGFLWRLIYVVTERMMTGAVPVRGGISVSDSAPRGYPSH